MYTVLVVDDEPDLRKQVVSILKKHGYGADEASNGLEASKIMLEKNYRLVLCDVRMPEMDGFEFLKFVRDRELSTAVALLTAHGNIPDAIAAIQQGAFDYVEKPVDENAVLSLVKKAERAYEMLNKIRYSAPSLSAGEGRESVAQSKEMKQIFQLVEKLSNISTSVLIRGENGTGKELVAQAIHYNGPRKDQAFVAINCGAIPENLIESELFGHEKGAFTGADQRKIGKFQYAQGGTIFLDEIGDTSPAVQVKLLRVLQEHAFTPVGSNREVRCDVRVVAATNQNLEQKIKDGDFREDLFYRLNVMPIFLPPLRERREDIPSLVHHFIDKYNQEHAKQIKGIDSEALDSLEQFHWPGNIRELENAIEHSFILENSDHITIFSIPEYVRAASKNKWQHLEKTDIPIANRPMTALDWEKGKETFEREFIIQALKRNEGKINLTAEQANIPKNTLLRKIKKYAINPKEYGSSTLDS